MRRSADIIKCGYKTQLRKGRVKDGAGKVDLGLMYKPGMPAQGAALYPVATGEGDYEGLCT